MAIPDKKPYERLSDYLERTLPAELEAGKSRGKATADIIFKFNEEPPREMFAPSVIGFAGNDLRASDSDVQAYFDAVTAQGGTLTEEEEQAIIDFVYALKNTGGLTGPGWMWRNSTYLYPMLGTNIASRTINLKDPSNTNSYLQLNGGWTLSTHGLDNNGVGWADVTTTGSLFQYGGIWAVTSQISGNGKILYGNYVSGSQTNNEMVLTNFNSSYWGDPPSSPTLFNAAYFQTNALNNQGAAPVFLPSPTNKDSFGYQWLGASIGYANQFTINTTIGSQQGGTGSNTIPGTRGVKATVGGAYDSVADSVNNIADVDFSFLWWVNDLTTTLGASTSAQVRDANETMLSTARSYILNPLNKT